jgi:hypothetical protein
MPEALTEPISITRSGWVTTIRGWRVSPTLRCRAGDRLLPIFERGEVVRLAQHRGGRLVATTTIIRDRA